jgi:hypothetical protein
MRLSKRANNIPTMQDLLKLRGEIVKAAQKIYDEWTTEEEPSGICDEISSAIIGILADHDIDSEEGGFDGDDHNYVVIPLSENHGFSIDIPWNIYEKQIRYYEYKKIEGVQFSINDVVIEEY